MKNPTFAKLCRKLRTQTGMTQKEFAEKLLVAEVTVKHWELGINVPRPPMKKQVENLYKKLAK